MRLALAFLAILIFLPLASAATAPKVSVQMAMSEKFAKPQDVVAFPATLRAASGRPAWVGFEVLSATEGFVAPVPRPVVLDDATPTREIVFVVQTPFRNGYVEESGTIAYRLTPRAGSESGLAGEPVTVQVVAHAKGPYVPAAGALLAMGALAVVAVLVRGRR